MTLKKAFSGRRSRRAGTVRFTGQVSKEGGKSEGERRHTEIEAPVVHRAGAINEEDDLLAVLAEDLGEDVVDDAGRAHARHVVLLDSHQGAGRVRGRQRGEECAPGLALHVDFEEKVGAVLVRVEGELDQALLLAVALKGEGVGRAHHLIDRRRHFYSGEMGRSQQEQGQTELELKLVDLDVLVAGKGRESQADLRKGEGEGEGG